MQFFVVFFVLVGCCFLPVGGGKGIKTDPLTASPLLVQTFKNKDLAGFGIWGVSGCVSKYDGSSLLGSVLEMPFHG